MGVWLVDQVEIVNQHDVRLGVCGATCGIPELVDGGIVCNGALGVMAE